MIIKERESIALAKRVADIILDSLIASGVKRIYGVSGDSLNGITAVSYTHLTLPTILLV